MKIKITNDTVQLIEGDGIKGITMTFHPNFVSFIPKFKIEKSENDLLLQVDDEGYIENEDMLEMLLLRKMEGEHDCVGPYFSEGNVVYTIAFRGNSTDPLREAVLLNKHLLQFVSTI